MKRGLVVFNVAVGCFSRKGVKWVEWGKGGDADCGAKQDLVKEEVNGKEVSVSI
jgi:hypothetical protein